MKQLHIQNIELGCGLYIICVKIFAPTKIAKTYDEGGGDVPKVSLSRTSSFPHRLARGADELEAS